MKSLATFIQAHPNAKSARPVDATEIKNQEAILELKFGSQYSDFLKEFGCLVLGPNEIYGICGKNDSIPSAIHATLSARKDNNFPQSLLVITEDGRGKLLCVNAKDELFSFERGAILPLNLLFEEFAIGWLSKLDGP